jgi:hypothetical protein
LGLAHPLFQSTGNVRLGIQEQEALLQEFEALAEKMGEPDADIDQLLEEQVNGGLFDMCRLSWYIVLGWVLCLD